MKFPNFFMNRSLTARALVLLAGLSLMAIIAPAQTRKGRTTTLTFADGNVSQANGPSSSLEQCRNGATEATAVPCANNAGGTGWVSGNVGQSSSHWKENDFAPYRQIITGLTPGSYSVEIGYDILKNGKHAVDYLGTYNYSYSDTHPCDGVTGCNEATFTTGTILPDTVTVTNNINPNTNMPIVQIPGVFTLFGGTITNVAYTPYLGGEHRSIIVTFTAGSANEVLAWGGHIGFVGDWGSGNSAGGISGSPYHVSQDSCSYSCGGQDRSLSADAVAPSAAIIIKKETFDTGGQPTVSTRAFTFTASASFTPSTFTLTDSNPTGGVTKTSDTITSFNTGLTVTESPSGGWTLLSIACNDTIGTGSGAASPGSNTAVINVSAFEAVTCTFSNGQLIPTAAPASITGQIVNSSGAPMGRIALTLVDVVSGEVKTTNTNSEGIYSFTNLTVDHFYQLSVLAKKIRIQDPVRQFTLTEDLVGVNFLCTSQ